MIVYSARFCSHVVEGNRATCFHPTMSAKAAVGSATLYSWNIFAHVLDLPTRALVNVVLKPLNVGNL